MTREELKEHCKRLTENCEIWATLKGEKPHGKIYEEHKLILELLEQKPVLDKLRAEIAEYGSIMVSYAITKDTKTDKGIEKLVSDVLKQAKEQVLQIIDKYKAESEKV